MKKIITVLLFFCISNISIAQVSITDIQRQGGGLSITEACMNETIRVIGAGFQATGMTMNVNNGPIVSTYTFISTNIIEFIIPAGTAVSGTGVEVTNTPFTSNARPLNVQTVPTITAQPITQTYCEGSPYLFSVSASGTSLVYNWKKNALTTGQTTASISGSALLADSGASYTVDIFTTACPTLIITSSPAKILVNKKPNNPTVLPNLNNCQNGTFTANAAPPNVGVGSWSCLSNCGITIVTPSLPNTQITGVPEGGSPPVLKWTVVNGVCSVPSTLTLLNYGMPTSISTIAGATDTSICTTSSPVSLAANSPSGIYTNVDWSLQGPNTGTFTSPTSNYTTFTPTSGAGAYIVRYYIRNGACFSVSNKQINVLAPPVISANGPYSSCFGTPLNLAGNAINASSFVWGSSGGNGSLSAVSGLAPIYNSFGADSLGNTFTVWFNASNAGCGLVGDTTTITIHSKPSAAIPVGAPVTICAGSSATIPVNFTGTPPFSGIGLFNGSTNTDLGSIAGFTKGVTVSPASSTNYTLSPVGTFIDGFGCPGTWQGSRFITVAPGISASISISPAIICAGDNATLTITPTGGGGPGWNVYFNTGGANTMVAVSGTNYSTTITPSSTTNYVVDSISTVGCGKVKIAGVSKTIFVNTAPLVSASMNIIVSDDTLCKNENATIEITGVQLNTMYRIIKNFNNIILDSIDIGNTIPGSATIVIPYSKFTPGQKDTLKFFARRVGCSLVPSINKVVVWTSALNNPVATVSTSATGCSRKIIQCNPQPSVSYQWFESNNLIVGFTNPKDTAYFSGTYSVWAKDTLACKLASNDVVVTYTGQEPDFTVNTISSTETKLTSVSAADSYFWYARTSTGIKKIQGANANSISVYFDGDYYLGTITGSCYFMSAPQTITGKLGGSLLKQSFIETDSSIILPDFDFSSDLRAYPNPISGSDLLIDYIAGDVTKTSFILYNPQGLPVVQKEVEDNGLIHVEIPVKGLPTGIYNLYINDGVKQIRKNIMIY